MEMLDFAKIPGGLIRAGMVGALGLAVCGSPLGLVRAQEPDKPLSKAAEDEGRSVEKDAVERLGRHLTDLADQIRKDAGPVAEEIRKALESAASTVNDTLKKDQLSAEDLRDAFDRAGEQLRRAFREGGPVDRETREAWEKARDELRDALRKTNEDARKALREQMPDEAEVATDADSDSGASDELIKARREVRELQGKLREAARKLGELERREAIDRRGRRIRPPVPPARPGDRESLEPSPSEPDQTAPEIRRGPGPRSGSSPSEMMNRQERRLRELEENMKQLREDFKSFLDEQRAKDAKKPKRDR